MIDLLSCLLNTIAYKRNIRQRCIFAYEIISISQSIRELLLDKLVLWKKKKLDSCIVSRRKSLGFLGQKWNLFQISDCFAWQTCYAPIRAYRSPLEESSGNTDTRDSVDWLISGSLFLSILTHLRSLVNSQHSTLPPLLSDHAYIMHERKESEQSMLLAMHASMVS